MQTKSACFAFAVDDLLTHNALHKGDGKAAQICKRLTMTMHNVHENQFSTKVRTILLYICFIPFSYNTLDIE